MKNIIHIFMISLIMIPMGFSLQVIQAPYASAQTASKSFQQLNSYIGNTDATISNQYIEWNQNGVTDKTGELKAYVKEEEGKTPYEKRALLKFRDLDLPQGAIVTSANLTLVVTDWESGYNNTPQTILKGYYLKNSWSISSPDLGWIHRDDLGAVWDAPGALGTNDIIAGKSFTLTGFDSSGDQIRNVELDPAIVQTWVDDINANQGIIIVNNSPSGHAPVTIHSSEDSDIALRPKLTINYTLNQSAVTTSEDQISPEVKLTSPVSGTVYPVPSTILLSANATDDGSISKVEFYAGLEKLGEDATAPYQFEWTVTQPGVYPFTAKAIDNNGLSTTSDGVSIIVNSEIEKSPAEQKPDIQEPQTGNLPPVVTLTAPANNSEYTAPANFIISANASDPDGNIARVDFYRGTTKIYEDSQYPYEFLWSNVGANTYDISAVAVDDKGDMTGSDPVHLVVKPKSGIPYIAITSPSNESRFNAPADIVINAQAANSVELARVDFYRGTTKIGEDTTAPYSYNWQNVGAGEYHISAVAVDNQGEMTGSQAVHLFVDSGNQAPSVSITSPVNDAEYTAPADISISANASDPDGSISRVDFYRGTTKIGEDTTAPYSYNWQNVGAGEYHISAVAVDNQGEMTGSQAVHVTVNQQSTTPPKPPASSSEFGVDMAVCNSSQVPVNAKYVSLSGNDSNDGSIAHPFRTVLAAVNSAQDGDTIVLRQGTYVEPSEIRIRVPNVTITSYPGEWAVIDRTADQDNAGIYFYVGSDGGSLKCVEVKGGFYAVSTETMWDWGEADRSGASNILIENTKLHDSFRDVVKIKPQSDDITIRHNEIYNSSQGQMTGDCNAEGIDNVNGDRNIISYNYIHNTCSNGVYLKGGATDGIVEYNYIENTGGAGVILGFDTSPEYFDLTANPDYYENINGIARHNLIRNTGWAGIALYASKDAQVYNNTIINSASIYHSPIYFGVTFQDWEPQAGRPANINPNIHNNIVVQNTVTRAPLVGIRFANELGGLSGLNGSLAINNNCYYQSSVAASFEDGRSDWTGGFADWQSHINGDSGSLVTNPMFDAKYKPTNPACSGMGY